MGNNIKITEEDNNAVVVFLKRNALAIIMALAFLGWQFIEPLIGKGAEAEFHQKLVEAYDSPVVQKKVSQEFEKNITDPMMLGKVLNSPEVDNFAKDAGKKIESTIVDNVLKDDSSKISMVSGLGRLTDIRDDKIMLKLSELLKAWDKGELMTKSEADKYIDRKLRRESPTAIY